MVKKRVTNEQIMEKLVKMEKNNRFVSTLAVVFFLQTISLTCFTLAFGSKDLTYLYLGLIVYAFATIIFIWGYKTAREK
jgi:EamA domain-containing membrane protein RarD